MKHLIMQFSRPSHCSLLLDLNISVSTLFSNTLPQSSFVPYVEISFTAIENNGLNDGPAQVILMFTC
jgi:hypothetical protein